MCVNVSFVCMRLILDICNRLKLRRLKLIDISCDSGREGDMLIDRVRAILQSAKGVPCDKNNLWWIETD